MINNDALNPQRSLMQRLVLLLRKESPCVAVFETHISWVLVTQDFAYKFKKAVHFDFLDFSTLNARDFYCREELRLNRRLAPTLYLGLTRITGSSEHPRIDAPGAPIEYAVKMRAFPQQALWSHRIAAHCIGAAEIDALATLIAQFHQTAAVAVSDSDWGAPDALKVAADENLKALTALVRDADGIARLDKINAWHAVRQQALRRVFEQRKTECRIRECHGDLHSANILTLDDQVQVFDCIEFNESLRWIDVINDIAFACMDLEFHGRRDLAARFLNQYLQISGDYGGVAVLRYYQLHRALVRCKVALLRARQLRQDGQDAAEQQTQADRYLACASACTAPSPAAIMITHGYSGSGKSTFATCVVESIGAIQLRSDIERKRLHGMAATQKAAAAPDTELYHPAATRITYQRLLDLTRGLIESGKAVIVDAAFLHSAQRVPFRALARELGVPFFIFDMQASEAAMRERIAARAQAGSDASDAGLDILAHQLAQHDPLAVEEMQHAVAVDTEAGLEMAAVKKIIEPVLRAMRVVKR
jgi:uncharacterized protein